VGDGYGARGVPAVNRKRKKDGDAKSPLQEMNRAFLIVLGPTALVAIGYILVLRAMGMEPGYLRLTAALGVLGSGFWWIGRIARKKA
jgi:hypothetical protein